MVKIQSRPFALEVSRSYVFVRLGQYAAHFGRSDWTGLWFAAPYGEDH